MAGIHYFGGIGKLSKNTDGEGVKEKKTNIFMHNSYVYYVMNTLSLCSTR